MKNILFVLLLLFSVRISAQTSRVNWSLFSIGFGNSASVNLSVRSITGQPLFGNGSNSTTNIGSGFFYNPDATGFITEVNDEPDVIPTVYNLFQNYPNPFNPSTIISFSIPASSFVTIRIFDVLGSEVANLVNEEKSAGNYEITFDSSGLSSGVYLYKIQAGKFVETKKMILLR